MIKTIQILITTLIVGLTDYFLIKSIELFTSKDLGITITEVILLSLFTIMVFMLFNILTCEIFKSSFTKEHFSDELSVIVKDKNVEDISITHITPVGKMLLPRTQHSKNYNTIVEDEEGTIYEFQSKDIYDTFKIGDSAKLIIVEYKAGQEVFTTERMLIHDDNNNKRQ